MATNNAAAEAEMRRSMVAGGIIAAQGESIRQQEAIRQLAADNEKLKKEIASVTGVPYDFVKADKYATLKGEVDALERRYQFEKMKRNELTRKYQMARIDLLQSRRLKGGVNAEKENAEAVQRQVELLENRLDQALTKFNDSISYNKELRDNIDIIREERRVFQRVYKKMEDDLRAKKKLMSERIEQSNKDLDERDTYLRHVEQLQKAIEEQKQQYAADVREMDMAMVEIREMREEQQRLQLELEANEYEFGNDADSFALTNATATGGDAGIKRRGPLEDGNESPQDDAPEHSGNESVTEAEPNLDDVLMQLSEFSEDDLNTVAKRYEALGDANFSLYKYVNELTTNREEMQRDIHTLKAVIAAEHENEERQRRLIKKLEDQLAETEGLLEQLLTSAEQHRGVLSSVRTVTEEVFNEIGCSKEEAKTLLGGTDQCTESNLLHFLGLIEERAMTIMCAYQRHHRKELMRTELVAHQNDKVAFIEKEDAAPIAPASVNTAPDNNTTANSNDVNAEEEEDNALTLTAESQKEETVKEDASPDVAALAATTTPAEEPEELAEVDEVPPYIPVMHMAGRQNISAARLVRQACLPSAHLGGDEGVEVVEEWDGDPVVSHDEIRQQMEQRLLSKREREERAHRRKRELKEQLNSQLAAPRRK